MTVLVTGARGAVGRGVLDGLVAAGVDVRAGSRDPSKLALPDGATPVAVDLDDAATWPAALDGVDAVFSYVAGSLADFGAAARDAGVGHVVLLSSASVVEADPSSDPLAGHHAQAEQALRDAGLDVTALRPGAFDGNARDWARGIATDGVVELPFPRSCTAPIHEQDIADAAVAALVHGTGRGESPLLSGPESLSFADQVDVLARELGREIGVREVDPDVVRGQMAAHGAPPAIIDSLFRLWAAADRVPAEVTGEVERLTGHPARPFARWVRENAGAFGS